MRRRYTTTIACASLALLAAGTARAATITWGPAAVPLTSTGTEVSTSGTLVQALNFGRGTPNSAFDTEINGVPFTGIARNTGVWENPISGNFSANSTNVGGEYSGLATYSTLLNNWVFGGNTVTLSGLTSGQEYLVQLFMADSRSNRSGYFPVIDDGEANEFTGPQYGTNSGDGFVINGTFTAGATSQTFTINNYAPGSPPTQANLQLNAYQIRAVPEPATIGLLGAAGLMLALRRGRGAFRRRP